MRLVIDMQACLTDSRDRGIGRYAMALTQAIGSSLSDPDELVLTADIANPLRVRELRNELRRRGVDAQVVAYGYPVTYHTDASPAARCVAGQLRARYFASLRPDVLLITTFFETGTPYCMELDWPALDGVITAIIAYDVIPLRFPEHYLTADRFCSVWYVERVNELSHFDVVMAISNAVRDGLIEFAGLDRSRITVVNGGYDEALTVDADADGVTDKLLQLGVTQPFVLTVGNGDWRKNTIGAVAAFARLPKAVQASHQLVLTQVGDDVRAALEGEYAELSSRVRVLGHVDDATLATLYQQCEVFYFPSYFEGFGLPVLEAMALNAVVLSSNAGALPEVIHDRRALFDPKDPSEGASLLARALGDREFRETLRDGAREHALKFTWRRTAESALQILRSAANERRGVVRPPGHRYSWPNDQDISVLAGACIESGDRGERVLERGLRAIMRAGRRRVLVDLTEVVRRDARTGIQRVTRNFFAGLFAAARENHKFDVEPICWTEQGIVYARGYARTRLHVPCPGPDDGVQVEPSDLVFMLDSSWWQPERFDELHAQVHEAGGEVIWMVYDLIPVQFPETCDPGMPPAFRAWLTHAVLTADGFTCISDATRGDLEAFISGLSDLPLPRPWTCTTYLGSDLDPTTGTGAATEQVAALQKSLGGRPYFVSLGTIEPRKDYGTTLDAFERVWERGGNAVLVIIGKQGWNVEALVSRICEHSEYGRRLFWLQSIGDADVQYLLRHASALIQASISEGFGLPLIEAGRFGVPLLVSDIAVFHEIAKTAATYFPVGDATALQRAISTVINGTYVRPAEKIASKTWREASLDLVAALGLG